MEVEKKLLITVKEARKLIGKGSVRFSDLEMQDVIIQLGFLAEMTGKTAYEELTEVVVPKST